MGAVRVVVVDDSGFFRRRIVEMLNADAQIEVVGMATNGAEGVQKVMELKPDVVTMDIEMPVMDGISAVKEIMSKQPTPVLMFSSLTQEGAQATLDALEAGALDFLPKNFEDISKNRDEVQRLLCRRVSSMARRVTSRQRPGAGAASPRSAPLPGVSTDTSWRVRDFSLVAIGASTGGPVALQNVLTRLPANFPLPLLLIQHMPASFTPAFAERLNKQCAITVKEARDGDPVEAGVALLAPGGKQMVVESVAGRARVKIQESPPGQHYNPCVDTTFESAAKAFPGKVLAIVLTGMGADGREGARMLKKGGATIWAQDEASSVIYGMPAAVVEAGLANKVLPLDRIGPGLAGGA